MSKFKQGKIETSSLKGYNGKARVIHLRSSYEFKAVRMLEQLYLLKRIKGWCNEETIIQYHYSLDGKSHRYYMDLTIITNDDRIILIEVKPYSQTIAPKKPKTFKNEKQQVNYQNQVATFIKNKEKWEATQEYCNKMNQKIGPNSYSFLIWTENELSIKK